MDKKEFDLLAQLRKDSRRTLSQIGRDVEMPVSTVHDRMKKIKKGIIKKYTCILDFKSLGFNCRAQVVLRLHSKDDRGDIKEYLLKNQNVNSVYKINNGYDFLAELIFRDISELDGFIDRLEERFKIREKKVYYIIDDVAREVFLSDQVHAGLLGV
ncbi:TPA: Lrp/AsnC family transcriptional regulator [Candidatus Woesearchaeota archaeon]|nr:Lrp/AsnC family transcriptional regulator [Candidatus Woesearchaeota archaeon]